MGGNGLFLHCRNYHLLTVVAVAHFDPHLAGRSLSAIGRADDYFSHTGIHSPLGQFVFDKTKYTKNDRKMIK